MTHGLQPPISFIPTIVIDKVIESNNHIPYIMSYRDATNIRPEYRIFVVGRNIPNIRIQPKLFQLFGKYSATLALGRIFKKINAPVFLHILNSFLQKACFDIIKKKLIF